MERKWVVRQYEEGDEEKILDLWKAVHPEKSYDREKWMKWWRWLYKDNPLGAGRIWLAEHDGKIVGQYTMVPASVKIDNEVVPCGHGPDLMTHHDYRRQKIFETLATRVYYQAEKEGVLFLFGFANRFSHIGLVNKLNWFDISVMPVMLRPLNWGNIISIKVSNKLLLRLTSFVISATFNMAFREPHILRSAGALAIKHVSNFDDRFDRLWTRISCSYPIMLVRNKEYLNWRYVASGADYTILSAEKGDEVVGYLVSGHRQRRNRQASVIYDLIAESEQAMQYLLSEAIKECSQSGDAFIEYRLTAGKAYHKLLRESGFLSLPFIKGAYFCGYINSKQLSISFLKNPKNWFVQIGDSDSI
jgi:GNAT superfamily N-acetyltransferase